MKIEEFTIELSWSTLDIQSIRPDLNFEEAKHVLLDLKNHHDACVGVNWEVIGIVADILYPKNRKVT